MQKVAILSYNGSCGKTIVATRLLLPRMPESTFFAVETINLSATDLGVKNVETLAGKNFGELIEALVLEDNAIVDIGASNIEQFFEQMSRFEGAVEEFDKYLIPVTPEPKSWQEGAKTASALSALGIPADKIILLPNRIERDPREEIPSIYNAVEHEGFATIRDDAFVFESEVFEFLNHNQMSFEDLIGDNVDYREKARKTKDKAKAQEYARLYRWTRQAIPVRHSLDNAFRAIMEPASAPAATETVE